MASSTRGLGALYCTPFEGQSSDSPTNSPLPSLLFDSKKTDKDLQNFPSDLTSLSCSIDARITQQGLKALANLSKLKNLQLQYESGVGADLFEAISTLRNLEKLGLSGGTGRTRGRLIDQNLKQISRLSNLKILKVTDSLLLTDEGVFATSQMSNLEELDFSECINMTEYSLESLPLSLVKLVFPGYMTEVGIQFLTRLPKLKDLTLTGCVKESAICDLPRLKVSNLTIYNAEHTAKSFQVFSKLDVKNKKANWSQRESPSQNDPFHFAAWAGDTKTVKSLLSQTNIDPNKKDSQGNTPLHWAAKEDRVEVVLLLLADSRVDVRQVDSKKNSPFYVAVEADAVHTAAILKADPRVSVEDQIDSCHFGYGLGYPTETISALAMQRSNEMGVLLLTDSRIKFPRLNPRDYEHIEGGLRRVWNGLKGRIRLEICSSPHAGALTLSKTFQGGNLTHLVMEYLSCNSNEKDEKIRNEIKSLSGQ